MGISVARQERNKSMTKITKQRLAVVDLETDPEEAPDGTFLPFVVGFYDGYDFNYWWDDADKPGSCIGKWVSHMRGLKRPYLIYAHNGGKFDFMLMLEHLEKELFIQNSRIVKCHLGIHEMRDSYSIIPVRLDMFGGKDAHKQHIGDTAEEKQAWYRKHFSRENRLKYKKKTIDYLRDDCLALYEGVKRFREEFGDRLTIGGTSMRELKKHHSFETAGGKYDEDFRKYYFGGRNQCFAVGELKGDFKIYDVNSMYPYVMRDCLHPVSTGYDVNVKLNDKTTFAMIDAINEGCLPVRGEDGGLDFTVERGTFFASIHEINAGLETRTLKISRIRHTIEHKRRETFATFVEHFYQKRLSAKDRSEDMLVLFYKLILNSAYGKFAQNPENYSTYIITQGEIPEDLCPGPMTCPYLQGSNNGKACTQHWQLDSTNGSWFIWSKPSSVKTYFNVATAASITGASRALLLRGLSKADNPIYCDTDSIICEGLNAQIDDKALGCWKMEGRGNRVLIAGKKLYAVYLGEQIVKQANKGAKLTPSEIAFITAGGKVTNKSIVPHFKFDGSHHYVTRTIVATKKSTAPFRRRVKA